MNMIRNGARVNPLMRGRITKGLSSGLFVFALVTGAYSAGSNFGGAAADGSTKSTASSGQNDSEEGSHATAATQINSVSQSAAGSGIVSAVKESAGELEEFEFSATAYSLSGPTASGSCAKRGMIAADPKVLPIGTLVLIRAGSYSGTYRVTDTGGKIKGRKIDIFIPDHREALNFGRRSVKLKVLGRGLGAEAKAANKESLRKAEKDPTSGIEVLSSDK